VECGQKFPSPQVIGVINNLALVNERNYFPYNVRFVFYITLSNVNISSVQHFSPFKSLKVLVNVAQQYERSWCVEWWGDDPALFFADDSFYLMLDQNGT